jgi:hypothetical protein
LVIASQTIVASVRILLPLGGCKRLALLDRSGRNMPGMMWSRSCTGS